MQLIIQIELTHIVIFCYFALKHRLWDLSFIISFVCLFGLMLYVHGQQLRSCRDGQLSYPHCSGASLLEAGNQYLAHILSPLNDNCSS